MSVALSAVALWRPLQRIPVPRSVAADSSAKEQGQGHSSSERSGLPDTIGKTEQGLSGHEYATVAAIAAIIVPTDHDPGATEANVAGFINRKVSQDVLALQSYQQGVSWIDKASSKLYGRGRRFIDLGANERVQLLGTTERTLDKRLKPVLSLPDRVWRKVYKTYDDLFGLGEESRFFRIVREDTLAGFYTSPVSWAMLDYIGPPQPRGYPHYQDCPPQDRR